MALVREAFVAGLPDCGIEERLKELSFGAWEGRTWDDLKRAEPAAIAARRADAWGFVPPGGESYAMLLDRLEPWLAALPADAVVVAHGGVARALMHRVARVGPAAGDPRGDPPGPRAAVRGRAGPLDLSPSAALRVSARSYAGR